MMTVNFHGIFETRYEEMEKYADMIFEKKDIREIYINLTRDKLLIGFPVYRLNDVEKTEE